MGYFCVWHFKDFCLLDMAQTGRTVLIVDKHSVYKTNAIILKAQLTYNMRF